MSSEPFVPPEGTTIYIGGSLGFFDGFTPWGSEVDDEVEVVDANKEPTRLVSAYLSRQAVDVARAEDAVIWMGQVAKGEREFDDALSMIQDQGVVEAITFTGPDGRCWARDSGKHEYGPLDFSCDPAARTTPSAARPR